MSWILGATLALAAEGPRVVLTLSDGQELRGYLLARSESVVVLELLDGQRLELPARAVRAVADEPGAGSVPTTPAPAATSPGGFAPDPNSSRYFYSPSAFPLGQGNGYLAQRELAITSAGVGITEFWDIEAGTIVPLLFTEAPVGLVGTKLTARAGKQWRVGLGAQAFFVDASALGFVFANTTYGHEDRHGTVAAGVLMDFTTGEVAMDVLTTSLNWRLGDKAALVTEVWWTYIPRGEIWPGTHLFIVPAGGVRLFGPKFAVDLGLVPVITAEPSLPVLPLPWISFAWNWSLNKSAP